MPDPERIQPLTLCASHSILNTNVNRETRRSKRDVSDQMDDLDLKKLESRVDDLIKAVERLQQENKTLRTSQTSLLTERTDLIEKTEMARSKVEAMIKRLKALEND